MERSGRFAGLQNEDGSAKTECGMHPEHLKLLCSALGASQKLLQRFLSFFVVKSIIESMMKS